MEILSAEFVISNTKVDKCPQGNLPEYAFIGRSNVGKSILGREQMTNLFVLIDCRLEPQKIDLEFMEWLGENEVPFAIIFTKADKLSGGKAKDNVNKYLKKLSEQWEELPPYFLSSSEKKLGRKEILDYIESINRSVKG